MSIVVYPDVIVPTSAILAGVTGTRTRQNDRTVNQGGYATVNAVRDVSLLTYQIGIAPMLVSDAQAIIALYETTDAGAFGMLMDDPIDFTVTGAQGGLVGYMAGVVNGTAGFGNGTPLYGLRKLYTAPGGRQKGRAITRPKAPVLLRNGAAVTVGASAGNISLSAAPVYATFVADSTSPVSGITVGATTQVTLTGSLAGLAVGGKLWLQGLTGANASLVNNLAHTITAISGAIYTLSTVTTGKTITAAGGTGAKYPQPTDTLTWSGDFYVPVHFRDDSIQWEIVAAGQRDSRMVTIPATYLDEIREA